MKEYVMSKYTGNKAVEETNNLSDEEDEEILMQR
jgi:hypothetical protein